MSTKHDAATPEEFHKGEPIGYLTTECVYYEKEPLFNGDGTIGGQVDKVLKHIHSGKEGFVRKVCITFNEPTEE